MGIVQVPDYKFLWSTNKFLSNGGVKEVMPVKRYEKLTQYLHVSEPVQDQQAESPDKLARIRPILDSVLERCRVANKPRKNQSIDEAMIPYKGRFAAKQYVPSKPVKWGIKVWMRCDTTSGTYMYINSNIYKCLCFCMNFSLIRYKTFDYQIFLFHVYSS